MKTTTKTEAFDKQEFIEDLANITAYAIQKKGLKAAQGLEMAHDFVQAIEEKLESGVIPSTEDLTGSVLGVTEELSDLTETQFDDWAVSLLKPLYKLWTEKKVFASFIQAIKALREARKARKAERKAERKAARKNAK